MSTRKLVITADDLGRDPATTAEILALATEGAITATTLITVTEHSAAAAARVRRTDLEPHLHLTLNRDEGFGVWRPLSDRASLCTDDGTLPVAAADVADHARGSDVIAEAEAQLSWMHSRGMRPRAVDSHAGTVYGLHGRSFLKEILPWCARHGLAFRLPREPAALLGERRTGEVHELYRMAIGLADQLHVPIPGTVITNTRTSAQLADYAALRDHMISLLTVVPEGTSELFLHPSAFSPRTAPERVWEARLLRDPQWRRALEEQDIEIVTGWWG